MVITCFRSYKVLNLIGREKWKDLFDTFAKTLCVGNDNMTLWTRWRKDLTGLPDRLMMGATTVPKLPTKECKVRVILSFPTHKVFAKVSKRSVVGMASKLTSRVAPPSKTFWSPPRTKTLWSTKVVPFIGTNVVT